MKDLKSPPIKALRAGCIGVGKRFLVSTDSISEHDGAWICGSDFMVDQLLPDLPKTVYDMLEACDGKVTLLVEDENQRWKKVWIDYNGEIGGFIMQLRHPLCISMLSKIGDHHLEIPPDKVVPLPPEFEQALSDLPKHRNRTFRQFQDGAFKLGQ